MKTYSKALVFTMCVVVLLIGSAIGTIAYLTDTEAVSNTFTVGSVRLTLDEADVNEMGQPLKDGAVVDNVEDADRWKPNNKDTEQKYHLLPGHTYVKDPTATIDAGSEEAYVRMMVTVTVASPLTDEQLKMPLDGIFLDYQADKWIRNDKTISDDRKTITYEYRYYTTVDGKNDAGVDTAQPLPPLFTGIAVPGDYDNDMISFLNDMSISLEAHAIQAAGFNDADAAWESFGNSN